VISLAHRFMLRVQQGRHARTPSVTCFVMDRHQTSRLVSSVGEWPLAWLSGNWANVADPAPGLEGSDPVIFVRLTDISPHAGLSGIWRGRGVADSTHRFVLSTGDQVSADSALSDPDPVRIGGEWLVMVGDLTLTSETDEAGAPIAPNRRISGS
jgi:hypothetical protein